MNKRGILRGSLSSIGKYIRSAFDVLRKNIPTVFPNVRQSAPKNSGSKTSSHRSSHKANSNPPRKPYGKVKSLKHNEEAGRRAEDQGREEENELVKLVNRFVKKPNKKLRKRKCPRSRQSSLPRGRGGIFKFWN